MGIYFNISSLRGTQFATLVNLFLMHMYQKVTYNALYQVIRG